MPGRLLTVGRDCVMLLSRQTSTLTWGVSSQSCVSQPFNSQCAYMAHLVLLKCVLILSPNVNGDSVCLTWQFDYERTNKLWFDFYLCVCKTFKDDRLKKKHLTGCCCYGLTIGRSLSPYLSPFQLTYVSVCCWKCCSSKQHSSCILLSENSLLCALAQCNQPSALAPVPVCGAA